MKRIHVGGVIFISLLLLGPFVPRMVSFLEGISSRDLDLEADITKWGGTIEFADGIAIQGNIRHMPRQEFLAKAFYRIISRDPEYNQVWKDDLGYRLVGSKFIWTYSPLID